MPIFHDGRLEYGRIRRKIEIDIRSPHSSGVHFGAMLAMIAAFRKSLQ